MRGFEMIGNHHLYKIGIFHTLGTPESERLKVIALNLFHPTAFSLLKNVCFFSYCDTAPRGEGETCLSINKGG
jgi:hypothetical protein